MASQETCLAGRVSVCKATIDKLTSTFFTKAGRRGSDRLLLEDFRSVLRKRPDLVQSFQTPEEAHAFETFMHPSGSLSRLATCFSGPVRLLAAVLRILRVDDFCFFTWISIIFLAQVAGFVVAFKRNNHGTHFAIDGWTLPIAKGSAKAIQVVMTVFPFTMARSFLTVLRSSPLTKILPMNKHLDIHKTMGYHLLLWSAMHTFCHVVNIKRFSEPARHQGSPLPVLSQRESYSQEVSITGVLLAVSLVLGYLFAVTWPGRRRLLQKLRLENFFASHEVFYITHLLMGISLLVLLIIHPLPTKSSNPQTERRGKTWMYLAPGTIVCLLERLARALKRTFWNTAVVGIILHQGGVTELRIEKPRQIRRGLRKASGKAGQFCYLNVPELSHHEWHPFSLTSGPKDDYISFHIQGVGGWTKGLYSLCESKLVRATTEDILTSRSEEINKVDVEMGLADDEDPAKQLRVLVDGPFGAPAQDHSSFTCLLLVGAGIGVTPFLSVLKQLMSEYQSSLCDCCKTANKRLFKPRKVYFYWLTRDQRAPSYFKTTLEEIKEGDVSDFLEINICLTQALPLTDPRLALTNATVSILREQFQEVIPKAGTQPRFSRYIQRQEES